MKELGESGRTLAPSLVAAMWHDYQGGMSLAKVGRKYGRTRQSVYGIFLQRRAELRHRKFLPAVVFEGRKFTRQKTDGRHRYLRETTKGRGGAGKRTRTVYLHHEVWQRHRGAIPAGHKIVFKDGNSENCDISNLLCMTVSDQVRRGATGANYFTKTARAKLGVLLGSFESGGGLLTTALTRRNS